MSARWLTAGKNEVTLSNSATGPLAFFNRLSLVDKQTHKRILPVFYSDNYLSILPGQEKKVVVEYDGEFSPSDLLIQLKGWNVPENTAFVN